MGNYRKNKESKLKDTFDITLTHEGHTHFRSQVRCQYSYILSSDFIMYSNITQSRKLSGESSPAHQKSGSLSLMSYSSTNYICQYSGRLPDCCMVLLQCAPSRWEQEVLVLLQKSSREQPQQLESEGEQLGN